MKAHRGQNMLSPVIPEVASWIAGTPGTMSLGQGVAWFPPPPEVGEAVREALDTAGINSYGPWTGSPALVEAIQRKLKSENRLDLDGSQIVVTTGANMAFCHAIQAIGDPGDEIILPSPYYFNHHMAITMAGMKPVAVPTRPNHQLDLDALVAAVGPKTRAIVTVSPNNPSGAVYPQSDLAAVNSLCAENGLFHISDEAYEYFVWDGYPHFSPGALTGAKRHTISLFSLSKSYGFAGWRIGYMVVPDSIKESLRKIQDTQLICPPGLTQVAATAALNRGREWPDSFKSGLTKARDTLDAILTSAPGIQVAPSEGAFYFLAEFPLEESPENLVQYMIRHHRIAALPATTFGARGCTIRFSYGAIEPDKLDESAGRLSDAIGDILSSPRKMNE